MIWPFKKSDDKELVENQTAIRETTSQIDALVKEIHEAIKGKQDGLARQNRSK